MAGPDDAPTIRKTFCRFCEVNCGLEAEVDADGRLVRLRPDKEHPVTQGFACHKGLLATDLHHDPDRLNRPQKKTAHGFADADWDEAFSDIGARLAKLVEEHGPESVAVYIGNPGAFNTLGGLGAGLFAAILGGARLFNAGTQDCANKFAVSEILYGSPGHHPVADLNETSFALLIGTNPRVSKMSFLSTPDPVGTLRRMRDRGAEVVFVNPLAIDDLADVGPTMQIVPDSDAYLLAALLCEIERDATLGFDAEAIAGVVGIDRLREFVRRYPADRVAPIVGLAPDEIRSLARRFATADGAAIHVSTGVNMGRQGALAYWLAQMLSLVTGNLDRPGGNRVVTRGTQPLSAPPEASAPRETRWGTYRPPTGTTPGALLGEMIADDEQPIRALFVMAGNPALSIAGGDALSERLASLDLLVCSDFYRNATGELADWVLPATDWLEREDVNYFTQGFQLVPYVQWTDAVVEPTHERREDARIFDGILRAAGRPSFAASPEADLLADVWGGQLDESLGCTIDALRTAAGGVIVLPEADSGHLLARHAGPDGFDCCPAALGPALARADAIAAEWDAEGTSPFRLITRRTQYMINSALQNLKALKTEQGSRDNPLFMNPIDAARLELHAGQRVVVRNQNGEVQTSLELDDALREGVVAMSHGFGNARASAMTVASRYPGVNVNALSPAGAGGFDPVSAMSHLTGIPVEVAAA